MPFTVNENTYITVEDTDQYFNYENMILENDARKTAWDALSYGDKQTYLKRAAEEIDSLKFVGIKMDSDQKMAFPRKYILHEDDEVPQAIKEAQALEALELCSPTSDTAMAEAYAGNVRSYALGSVSENLRTIDVYSVKAVIKSVRAQRKLAPYLGGGYRVR
jgi:hypothetical protein